MPVPPLPRRPWLVPVLIVACSVAVRAAYVVQLRDAPGSVQHRWEESDLFWNDHWGRTLAAGDWLVDRPFHPYLSWQQEMAARALAERPGLAERLRAEGAEDPVRELHDRWLGGRTFYQEPLYAYLVGLTYRLAGPDPRWVYAWQLALGVLGNLLVWGIARRCFGDAVAAVAAALVVASGVVLHYELTLLRDAITGVAALGLVALALRALDGRPRAGRWLALGVASGLALLLKTIFLPWVLVVLAVAAWRARGTPRALAAGAGAMAAGIALALAPAVARNVAVGVPPLAFSGVASWAFAQANVADYAPEAGMFFSDHVARIVAESEGALGAAVRATLATHDGIGSMLRLLGAKALVALSWFELPNNTNFYYYRLQAPVLALLPVGFGVLAPLALPGVLLAARAWRAAWPLACMVAVQAASLLVFFTLSRYRAQLIPTLAPFGALTLVRVGRWLADRRLVPAAATCAAVALAAAVVWRPLAPGVELIPAREYALGYQLFYEPQLRAAAAAGDWSGVARILDDSLRLAPPVLAVLGPARPVATSDEALLAAIFANVYRARATARRRAGDAEAAAHDDARAAALAAAGAG